MADLNQRKYYKIFTGSNQADGYDKVHLGYEAETTEITLKRDTTTFFHMPFFADITPIQQSSLVADGAIPGPIPALADRIYKKLGNYGNTTPWGTSTQRQDGTWLCTWLYAVSSEPPIWKDRYYNPGRLAYKEALEGKADFTDYITNKQDQLYFDIDSELTLEPGVLYQYFHNGTKSAEEAVHTFSGDNKSKLRLSIENWGNTSLDKSIYNNTINISNFSPAWVESIYDPGYQDRNALSFNHTDFINAQCQFSTSYNLSSEFTLSMWVSHPNWSNATSTQLAGNLQRGGYGLFYNNLWYNPFFVIPETFYGHLFFFNQDGNFYFEKNIQNTLGRSVYPSVVNVNSDQEIIGLVSDFDVTRLYKYDHLGLVITQSRTLSGGLYNFVQGSSKTFIIDQNNNTVVLTTSGVSVFDKDLLHLGEGYNNFYDSSLTNTPYFSGGEILGFDINGKLHREQLAKDIKFDSFNNKWTIKTDGNVYCNNTLIQTVTKGAIKLAVDPENNIWVLSNSNTVFKISPITRTIITTFEVGAIFSENKKNIGFYKSYNRAKNDFTWYSVIVCDNEKTVYITTLDGSIYKNYYLPPRLNVQESATALQNPSLLTFDSFGDFTGYEWKRIFNKIVYNNNPQIQFKISTKGYIRGLPIVVRTISIPVQYFIDGLWNLVTTTFKNGEFKIYVNNYLRDSYIIPQNTNITYNLKNNLIFGCPYGEANNLNSEIASESIIWNGYIDSFKIYDYAMELKFIQYLVREKIQTDDIIWNIPTAALQYVEVMDKFFKHKTPGLKSQFFKIRLTGTNITEPATKKQIEEDIKLAVRRLKPAYTELLQIEWIE